MTKKDRKSKKTVRKRKIVERGGTEEIMGRREKQMKITERCKKQKKMVIRRE
jgi:hypothetical protein